MYEKVANQSSAMPDGFFTADAARSGNPVQRW